MIPVTGAFKNLRAGLEVPDGDLNVFIGANNSGKSTILQYLNIHSPLKDKCDYVSPRRFDMSNTVTMVAALIRQVSVGGDGFSKKRVYLATHSHLFLDRTTLTNNYMVSKALDGHATIRQIQKPEELHGLIYHMLGNSPDDLFFPDNILLVEGPSDQIFWRRVLELSGSDGIAVHYGEGDGGVSAALPAIEQMLMTQAYIPWYRERLCVAVDASVEDKWLLRWRHFLHDDGERVRKLSKNGIEYFYPMSIIATMCSLPEREVEREVDLFIAKFRQGARKAHLGTFEGSKRELARAVVDALTVEHLAELTEEIRMVLRSVGEHRLSWGSTAVTEPLTPCAMLRN